MNLTYEQVKQVSQDPTLTPSQKMHEIFKNSKTTPLKYFIENSGLFDRPIEPSIKVDEAEVVEISGGQVFTFRYPDNSYHFVDAGMYTEIEGQLYIAVQSLDDVEDEIIEAIFEDFLN